ncbi:MAG: DNA polymerase III subunit delta' [Planctomycetaceae bacterium]|nr:DNA polymerase III subunit delta' [Planctomycetaceae bacterium]
MDTRVIWETIRGHSAQVDMFRQSFGQGRMSHAYLFVGPDGIGKRKFARTLAQCLFCESHSDEELLACQECSGCKQFAATSHPDFFHVERAEGKAELTLDVFLGPQDRRGREGLCHDLSLRPMASDRKLAIIDDADFMRTEAANALLKTLEEPPVNSMLILIAANADSVLPTIRSRCQSVRFSPLSNEDVTSILLAQESVQDANDAAAVASLSDGSLTNAAQLLDPAIRAIRDKLLSQACEKPLNPLTTSAAMIGSVEELGGNTGVQRQNAILMVRFLIEFYRQCLVALSTSNQPVSPAVEKFVSKMSDDETRNAETVAELLERAMLCETQLNQQMPFALSFESLGEGLGRIERGLNP